VFNEAKLKIMNGALDLDTPAAIRMRLYKSSSNLSTNLYTMSTIASVTNQVTTNVKGGGTKSLTTSVVVGANASTYKFTFANVIWSTSGGDITSVMNALIYLSGGQLIAWSKLSTSIFSVTSGNTLTIAANATGGAFTISGGTT
jgi:hypothetical protein